MVFLDTDDLEAVKTEVGALEERLRKAGHKPFTFQFHPWWNYSGTIAYLETAMELDRQLKAAGIEKAHIYVVAGHTQAGLQLGGKLLGRPWKVTGISVSGYTYYPDAIPGWCDGVAQEVGLPTSLRKEELEVDFAYQGTYGVPTPECIEAIKLAARTENLILDPVYTGKCMAGLIDHIHKGKAKPSETVVFMHTGGTPLIFQYAQELSSDLVRHTSVNQLPTEQPPVPGQAVHGEQAQG
jgi:1-aminocyclopropane-1-carboxylate deaminase/D-cysteine desulfhydrase-like pyridoxal-dependent ACC family enzyme